VTGVVDRQLFNRHSRKDSRQIKNHTEAVNVTVFLVSRQEYLELQRRNEF